MHLDSRNYARSPQRLPACFVVPRSLAVRCLSAACQQQTLPVRSAAQTAPALTAVCQDTHLFYCQYYHRADAYAQETASHAVAPQMCRLPQLFVVDCTWLLVGVPGLYTAVAEGLYIAGVAALPQLACLPAAVHILWPAVEQAPQPARVHEGGDGMLTMTCRYLSSTSTVARHQQITSSAISDKQATR